MRTLLIGALFSISSTVFAAQDGNLPDAKELQCLGTIRSLSVILAELPLKETSKNPASQNYFRAEARDGYFGRKIRFEVTTNKTNNGSSIDFFMWFSPTVDEFGNEGKKLGPIHAQMPYLQSGSQNLMLNFRDGDVQYKIVCEPKTNSASNPAQ